MQPPPCYFVILDPPMHELYIKTKVKNLCPKCLYATLMDMHILFF